MKDDALILRAWQEAKQAGQPVVIATVVKVSGSAYRRPGARMLIAESGDYIGSISGGCLESDLVKKAWWLTNSARATVRVYDNTAEDDAVWSFGLGCEGIVHVLVERWTPDFNPALVEMLEVCARERRPGLIATVISGEHTGERVALFPDGSLRNEVSDQIWTQALLPEIREALDTRRSGLCELAGVEVFFEIVQPPRALVIFGAGYDAVPVVALAKHLGWHVTVVDGRVHYARAERFPLADRVVVANLADPLKDISLSEQTAVVVMSHSLAQDAAFLEALRASNLPYVGVLGPKRRTERLLAACEFPAPAEMRAPIGLDIGAETPEEIALAILAEIQADFTGRSGGRLSERPGPIHLTLMNLAPQQPVLTHLS